MAEFVLTCKVQPLSGELCPQNQSEWVSNTSLQYQQIRDVIFGAPPAADVAVIIPVVVALAIYLNLPVFVGNLVRGIARTTGL
jgi:hypothetical protein